MSKNNSNENLLHALATICKNEDIEHPTFLYGESLDHGNVADVSTVTVTSEKTNLKLYLFLKQRPKNTNMGTFFKVEAHFYKQIMKEFGVLMSDHQNVSLPNVPKCYFASEDLIVMENLNVRGFKVWKPLNVAMDSRHINLVMKQYGKFHAFSWAYKQKFPEDFKNLGAKQDFLTVKHDYLVETGFYDALIAKVHSCFQDKSADPHAIAFQNFVQYHLKTLISDMLNNDLHDVLLHGDNWTFNYLFGKEDILADSEVYLIDFQICRRACPVLDLANFFCTSGCSQENFAKIDAYLQVYHKSLKETLEFLDCSKLYTWDELLSDWNNYAMRAVVYAAILNKLIIADYDESKENAHRPVPWCFDFVSRNEKKYHERIRVCLNYFYNNTIFSDYEK